jgi:GntR family transcriptional regulator
MVNNFTEKKTLMSGPIPVYYQLQNELKKYIEDGVWAPGEPIPSSRNIAETYDVSMGTVQKAVANLEKEKYLYCVQGKGTFVGTTAINKESIRYTLLREDFEGNDLQFKIKLIGIDKVDGFQPANRFLKIAKNEALYRIRRVFVSSSGPIVYAISYLPCSMFEGFEAKAAKSLSRTTMYEAIEMEYGLPTVKNKELFSIALADEETAKVLQIQKGSPVLFVEMLSSTYKEQPYEYRLGYWQTEKRKLYRELI